MATVRCKNCSNLVAFRGKSAQCPACAEKIVPPGPGDLLEPGESADRTVGPDHPVLVREMGRTRGTTISSSQRKEPLMVLLIGGVLGLLVLGVLLTVVWWMISRPRPAAPAPPPPPPTKTTPPPAPAPVPLPPPPPLMQEDGVTEVDAATTRPAPSITPPVAAPAPVVSAAPERWRLATPVAPAKGELSGPASVTERRLEAAIRRGVDHLLGHFNGAVLKRADDAPEQAEGRTALALYALLAAGKHLQEPKLDVRAEMRARLDRLKTADMTGKYEVYTRSVRLQCLAFANRPEDRGVMDSDLKWLLKAHAEGAFAYTAARPGDTRETLRWDHSCSQYGLLGVWAAAGIGLDVPAGFWGVVENHWLSTQNASSGGWSYGQEAPGTSMTTAGVNALLVTGDQLGNDRTQRGRDPTAPRSAAQRGLDFLAQSNRIASFHQGHYGYVAFGIERVGLASGYKFIGEVDWYRTIAAQLLKDQREDGGWSGPEAAPSDTAFCVLFLVRGRPPVMMSKLQYPGPWSRFPRDVANLAHYATLKTERELNWQVVDLKHSYREWLDSPVMMISGSAAVPAGEAEIEQIRLYAAHGGLVFTHADNASAAMTQWAQELAGKLVPGGTLTPLPPDHPVYSMVYRPNPAPPLLGLSNGNRLIMIHSPGEITNRWQRRVPVASQQNLEVGLNLFVYAAGKGVGRNRVATPVLPEVTESAVGQMAVARIRHAGNWDPEPVAWPRFAQGFELATRIRLNLKDTPATALPPPADMPVAVLTSTGGTDLPPEDISAIRNWVEAGGTLIVDACGGRKDSADWFERTLTAILGSGGRTIPPGASLEASSPLISGGFGDFGRDVSRLRFKDYTLETYTDRADRTAPRLTVVGKGRIISSRLDLTTALLDTEVWEIAGYSGDWASGFVQNVMLSVLADGPGRKVEP